MILYILSAVFIVLGIGIRMFKWGFLIAGYNTMGEEKKKNIDKDGLCNATGIFLIIIGVLVLIGGITGKYGYKLFTTISMLSILPLSIVFIIIAQKYDHNKKTSSSKAEIKFGVGIVVFTLLISLIILITGSKEPDLEITTERIRISGGLYNSSIVVDQITEISLQEEIPSINKKVNGFDFGYILRGSFTLEGMGQGWIYIIENKSPYIVIKTDDNFYIVNFKDSEKTLDQYEELEKCIQNKMN